jgi:glycosyltransferase involved in cell wall biosynthesis
METENRPTELLQHEPVSAAADQIARPQVRGKFLYVGDEKLYVRGVTYGTFHPGADTGEYDPSTVEQDFAQMAEHHINAVRVYTAPPRWLLDAALRHGLRVMVGLPWEQHVAFLDDRKRVNSIEERVRAAIHACAGHPAVLCYAIGNEIPASIVRWHGARAIEHFLKRLHDAVKSIDPSGLATYVNFPSTEYLDLSFVDIVSFNVYLEDETSFEDYLARLQNVVGEQPLLIAEVGLDSRRNGDVAQAAVLNAEIRAVFSSGSAGAFVFAWTDEWYRGGFDVEDWDFGLTDRQRRPKPALAAVQGAFADVPFSRDLPWPRVSIVVCTYNGARTIRDTLEGVSQLTYPNYETIVVDDGSTDESGAIAAEYDVHLIKTENRGLSSARNTGLAAATGDIVAYIDDDARPDPDWLSYLAATFMSTDYVGVGGPNITPAEDGPIAECVANAPGNPVHVLLSDREAEHIAGCNCAFRTAALAAIGGFDPRFRVAGDDVDVCWRLQDRGGRLGFSPGAVVWHHRRNSIRAYWRQQVGYGRAEALLERKWPEKYNTTGHLTWEGRLYGGGLARAIQSWPSRIYHGTGGTALFQSVYEPGPAMPWSLSLMPEWYFVVAALAALSVLGSLWRSLLIAVPFLIMSVAILLVQAAIGGARARLLAGRTRVRRLALHTLTAVLHLIQPLARLIGRLRHGLNPWRRRGSTQFTAPRPGSTAIWSEQWLSMDAWLRDVEDVLRKEEYLILRGGAYDGWDFEIRGGMLGCTRVRTAIEEHGSGKQLFRIKWWPRLPSVIVLFVALLGILSLTAALSGEIVVAMVLGSAAVLIVARAVHDCGISASAGHALGMLPIKSTNPAFTPLNRALPIGADREAAAWHAKGVPESGHRPVHDMNGFLIDRVVRMEPDVERSQRSL